MMSVPAIYLHEDDQCVFLGTGEGTRNGCKISVDDGVLRVCAHGEAVRRIKLFWPVTFVDGTKILADQWERGYGALSWHEPDEAEVMPWYFLAYSEGETQCFGVQTGPSGLCWWQIRKDGISLYADISCGADAVLLNGRTLEVCRIVMQTGEGNPFEAAQRYIQARRVVMIATGSSKAAILKDAFWGPVTPQIPASILQLHPDFTLVADEEALAMVNQEKQAG